MEKEIIALLENEGKLSGEAEKTDIALCQPYIERAEFELAQSDKIINGDLLRFYDEQTGTLLTE